MVKAKKKQGNHGNNLKSKNITSAIFLLLSLDSTTGVYKQNTPPFPPHFQFRLWSLHH